MDLFFLGLFRTSFGAHFPRGMICGNFTRAFVAEQRCANLLLFSGTSWDDKRSLQLTSSACSVRRRFLQYSEKVFAELVDRIFPDIQIYIYDECEEWRCHWKCLKFLSFAAGATERVTALRAASVTWLPWRVCRTPPSFDGLFMPFQLENIRMRKLMNMIVKLWYSLTDHGIWWEFRAFPTFSISDRTKASW